MRHSAAPVTVRTEIHTDGTFNDQSGVGGWAAVVARPTAGLQEGLPHTHEWAEWEGIFAGWEVKLQRCDPLLKRLLYPFCWDLLGKKRA